MVKSLTLIFLTGKRNVSKGRDAANGGTATTRNSN